MATTAQYNPTTWEHGKVITAASLNNIETGISGLYNSELYDIASGESRIGDTNKIATQASVTRNITSAINALDSTLTITNSAVTSGEEYRTILTSITETDGKLTSATVTTIPVASTTTLGLIKIGSNLSINDGVLAGNYITDQLYDSSTNPLATVSGVKQIVGNSIQTFATVTNTATSSNYNDEELTITSVNKNTTNGTVTVIRAPISIPHTQINDITIQGTATNNIYTIPTLNTVSAAITSAVSAAIVTYPVMSSLTPEQIAERDTAIANETEWTDPRPESGLISIEDKNALDEAAANINTLISNFTIVNGNIIGVKVYNDAGTSYKILTYDEITATAVPVGE